MSELPSTVLTDLRAAGNRQAAPSAISPVSGVRPVIAHTASSVHAIASPVMNTPTSHSGTDRLGHFTVPLSP